MIVTPTVLIRCILVPDTGMPIVQSPPIEPSYCLQGRPQDLGGGGGPRNFFFRFGNLHVAKRHAAHVEAMRIARGVQGHAPPRKFFKTVQFGAFRVYFDRILSLFFSKNAIFYMKNKYFRHICYGVFLVKKFLKTCYD